MLRGIHKASSNWIGRAVMGVVLGLIASVAWLIAGLVGAVRFGFDWRLTALLVALGAYGLATLAVYRNRILEH